jgi:S-adenosylmethionine decarboxylase
MFGPHLTIDLYECDTHLLGNVEHICKVLDEMPELLDMRKITEPQVLKYDGTPGSFDKGGVSAFVIIATSHISIHTFVHQRYASMDIFSCKEFDVDKALSYVAEKFKSKKTEINLIMRGKEFPNESEKAKAIVVRERKGISPMYGKKGKKA